MKPQFCSWCSAPVKVQDNYNETKGAVVCSKGCRDAEALFVMHYSDEAINRRAHYRVLTRGGDDE